MEEGDPVQYRFTRSGNDIDLSEPLTVYFLAGYAHRPAEWLETVIPAGSAGVAWESPTVEDDRDGPDLTFIAIVMPGTWRQMPLHYAYGRGSVSVTVKDDDLPVVTIVAEHEERTEGQPLNFTLTREGLIDDPLTVSISVVQTSDSETDEADFITGTPPSRVTFARDSATATLTVPTSNDLTTEPHATITVSIVDGEDDGHRAGDPGSASVRILDTDRQFTTSLSIAAQSNDVEEGEDAVFVVTRTGGTNLDLVATIPRDRPSYRDPRAHPLYPNTDPLLYSNVDRKAGHLQNRETPPLR